MPRHCPAGPVGPTSVASPVLPSRADAVGFPGLARRRFSTLGLTLVGMVILVTASGCASNSLFESNPWTTITGASDTKPARDPKDPSLPDHMRDREDGEPMPKPTFTIELHSGRNKPKGRTIPLEGVMFVQDALDMSGLQRIAGKYDVEVVRRTGDSYDMTKMKIVFDPRSNEVEDMYNYQILPGDRVICRPKTKSAWDEMMDSYFPLGRAMGM